VELKAKVAALARKRLGHSGGKHVARMTRREARWCILTRSQETKKGNPGSKGAKSRSLGSFSANVGLCVIISLWNVGTKQRCFWAGRVIFSGHYTSGSIIPWNNRK